MKRDDERPTVSQAETRSSELPTEIAGILGGASRRVPDAMGRASDSMLAVFGHRMTYTFICGEEVASIHFDRQRQEIFFRGHNIKFMELDGLQMQALLELEEILGHDRQGREFLPDYHATLARLLADKHR